MSGKDTVGVIASKEVLGPGRLIMRVVRSIRDRRRDGGKLLVGELMAPLGPNAPVLGAVILTSPFLFPLSLGPLTAPVSIVVAALGLQIATSAEAAATPSESGTGWASRVHRRVMGVRDRLHRLAIPHFVMGALFRFLLWTAWLVRRFCRPRLLWLTEGNAARWACGGGLILGAALLAVPTPGVPLMNTFPALGVMLLGVGHFTRDGVMVISAYVAYLIGAVLMLALGIAVVMLGWAGAMALFGGSGAAAAG